VLPLPTLPQLQLHDGTYTEATLPALRQVAEEVETTVGQAAARLKQVRLALNSLLTIIIGNGTPPAAS
jgi:hypothetical protein